MQNQLVVTMLVMLIGMINLPISGTMARRVSGLKFFRRHHTCEAWAIDV